jgi:hypothetical protein
MNIACLLHALATLVPILREVHYKGYTKKVFGPTEKCKIRFKKL